MIARDIGTTGPVIGFYTEEVFLTNMFSASTIFLPQKLKKQVIFLIHRLLFLNQKSPGHWSPPVASLNHRDHVFVFRGVCRFVSLCRHPVFHQTWGFILWLDPKNTQLKHAKTPYTWGDIWMDLKNLGCFGSTENTVPGLSLINGLVWIIQIPLSSNFELLGWRKGPDSLWSNDN